MSFRPLSSFTDRTFNLHDKLWRIVILKPGPDDGAAPGSQRRCRLSSGGSQSVPARLRPQGARTRHEVMTRPSFHFRCGRANARRLCRGAISWPDISASPVCAGTAPEPTSFAPTLPPQSIGDAYVLGSRRDGAFTASRAVTATTLAKRAAAHDRHNRPSARSGRGAIQPRSVRAHGAGSSRQGSVASLATFRVQVVLCRRGNR